MKAFEGEGFSREILFFQNVRNDVRYVFVLENTMVLPRAKKPQARNHNTLVMGKMIAPAQAAHFPDQPMHRAGLA